MYQSVSCVSKWQNFAPIVCLAILLPHSPLPSLPVLPVLLDLGLDHVLPLQLAHVVYHLVVHVSVVEALTGSNGFRSAQIF